MVGDGYCRLSMPLKLALGARATVAGHSLGALEGVISPHSNGSLVTAPPGVQQHRLDYPCPFVSLTAVRHSQWC